MLNFFPQFLSTNRKLQMTFQQRYELLHNFQPHLSWGIHNVFIFFTFIKLCPCIAHSFPFLFNNTYNKPILSFYRFNIQTMFIFVTQLFCFYLFLELVFAPHVTICFSCYIQLFACSYAFHETIFFGTIFYSSNHSS